MELTIVEKENIRKTSRMGSRGYVIAKSALSEEQLDALRKDLYAKPEVNAMIGGAVDGFYCYRESEKKVYIPRFYGEGMFGIPDTTDLCIHASDGEHLAFPKELRDYQKDIVSRYVKHVNTDKGGGAILEVPCGRGKTVMALKIISELKQKTLVIVHKEFLLNQWVERIQEFLPNARVGRIQGSTFDVEDKDIVIGMLQTLYIKDFGKSAFSEFGLTIIDEVHRIGSEQFSKALFKAVTPYMLGISATVERKDKLTHVLYMFIGERIYSEERSGDDEVMVRGVYWKSKDSDFNEVEYDWRGTPKYSTMLSKVSNFGPRSDFLVKMLEDLIAENNNKQIIVLTHQRALLTYMFQAIEHRGFATCGYYVGGMKPAALEESEGKQIVLATYAMAAEALDIKTLSTLVMASPKTDITQSVGRILRVRGNNPLVVDLIDPHEHFMNQWNARRAFYKKNGYRIFTSNSDTYKSMTDTNWRLSHDPNAPVKKEAKNKCLIKF